MTTKTEVPKEVAEFLSDLRDSGVTNMFGATPYLVQNFGFTRKEAQSLLQAWMKTK